MYYVMIETHFSAAHALRGYNGKCENLHGHNWNVEVYLKGEELDETGMLIDFKDLKSAARKVMQYLDHQNLSDLKPFDAEMNPSSECIARFILARINEIIDAKMAIVFKVRVWETPSTCATYELDSLHP